MSKRSLSSLIVLLAVLPLGGCYYMQAAGGQWEVLRKREPVQEVIGDPATPPELAARLRLISEARDFSVSELGLPDNKSYRSYSDLERDYVIWNVFAAPEFSLEPRLWCYPVAGCVSYRGYFSKSRALTESTRLSEKGFDVAVGGVAAYSTLGKFSDPILSTMMHWDDNYLIATLFHELAHQVVYVKDDTAFNESFATTVADIGLSRWLESRGASEQLEVYFRQRELRNRLTQHVEKARENLQVIYDGNLGEDTKRLQKRVELQRLTEVIAAELASAGVRSSPWLVGELNNARLISTSLYEGKVPAFRALYQECDQKLSCLYAAARDLAGLGFAEREAALAAGDFINPGHGQNEEQVVR